MSARRGTTALALAESFAASPLCPSAVEQTALCSHWAEHGAVVRARLVAALDARLVAAATNAVAPAWSAAAQSHVLGLGAAAYHYLAQPLGRPARHRLEVETVGALTQLVVAFYDHLLDSRVIAGPLPEAWFREALSGGGGEPSDRHPAAALVLALTTEWGRLVRRVGDQDPARTTHLLHLAAQMAVVEAATLTGTAAAGDVRAAELRARLPFEAVGAIARLARDVSDDDTVGWHRDWCGRLGAALGLVDDVVDLEDDITAGRVNRLAAGTGPTAAQLVSLLEGLHEEWLARTDRTRPGDHAQTLGMITRSWLAVALDQLTRRQLTDAPVG